MTAEEAEKWLKQSGLSASVCGTGAYVAGQLPAAGQSLPGGSQVLLYLEAPPEETLTAVPDFTGMNRQQAADTAASLGLVLVAEGNPALLPTVTVSGQSILKDTPVPPGTAVTLTFTDTTARD